MAVCLIVAVAGWSRLASAAAPKSQAQVYVLRGFMNLSPGFDKFADDLERRGIPATVANHTGWGSFAQDAIARYKRGDLRSIVIVGHSMGGGAALDMAAELGRAGVPVNLVVAIDPVGTSVVPSNVRRTINLYIPGGLGSPVEGGRTGAVQNLRETNPSIGHFSIIEARERDLIGYVLASTRGSPPKSGAAAPQASAGAAAQR